MKTPAFTKLASISAITLCLAACQQNETLSQVSQANFQPKASLPAEYVTDGVLVKNIQDKRHYRYVTLENGLQVMLVSDPNVKTAAASLSVGVGSNQNPENFLGLAHYLEHMVIQSSKKYPEENEFGKYVATNAGGHNAFTADRNTTYLFQINADALEGALDRLAAAIAEPIFEENFSERERNAVQAEWDRNLNNPGFDVFIAGKQLMNPQHPFTKFNVGNLATLKDQPNKSLNQALWDFYNQYYSANIMTLAIVSNQSLDWLEAKANSYFSPIKNRNIDRPQTSELAYTQTGKAVNIQIPQDTDFLQVFFPINDQNYPRYTHAGKFIMRQLNRHDDTALLGSLRKAGLTHDAGCSYAEQAYETQGRLQCHFNLTDKGAADKNQVVSALFSYIDIIKQQALTADYIAEYEHILAKQRQRFSDTAPQHFAPKLSQTMLEHEAKYVLMPNQFYLGFDKQQAEQILAQVTPENMLINNIGKNVTADQQIPYAKHKYSIETLPVFQPVAELAVNLQLPAAQLPQQSEQLVQQTQQKNYQKPTAVHSEKGLEVYLATSQYFADEDKAITTASIESPLTRASAKNLLMNAMLTELLQKQTRTTAENAKLMDTLHIAVSGNPNGYSQILLDGPLAVQQKYLTQLFTEFNQLQISQTTFDDIKARYLKGYKDMEKRPPAQQTFAKWRLTYQLYADLFTPTETITALESLTLTDMQKFHKQMLQGQLNVLSLSNMPKSQLVELAQAARQAMGEPTGEKPNNNNNFKPTLGKQVSVTESVTANDVVLLLGFIAPDKSDQTLANLTVLNQYMHPAFFNSLRTQQQLGYGVNSQALKIHDYPTQMFFVQSNNTDLASLYNKIIDFTQAFEPELAKLPEQTISQTISAIIQQVEQKPTDIRKEYQAFAGDWYQHNWQFDSRDNLVAALKQVTKQSLMATYQSLILQGQHEQFAVQYRGENFKDTQFAELKSLTTEQAESMQTAAR
ncbi:insulinase family protein [Catenovulum sp. SX2]|uniref:insulinase family protein n=1 Tax=Catenovulum sp. SX2 TaxID=3398614 RepID=UPI003F849220